MVLDPDPEAVGYGTVSRPRLYMLLKKMHCGIQASVFTNDPVQLHIYLIQFVNAR